MIFIICNQISISSLSITVSNDPKKTEGTRRGKLSNVYIKMLAMKKVQNNSKS